MKHRLLTGLLAGAAALTLAVSTVAPAAAGPTTPNRGRYAALGDSYAAGVGNTPLRGSGDSGRSSDAYPVLLAGSANKVTFLAESGATIASVRTEQVPMVPATANQLTLTVGGNDIGFSAIALECAVDTESAECLGALAAAAQASGALPGHLAQLIGDLRMRAPRATIYVTGYPLLFQPVAAVNFCPAIQAVLPSITPGPLLQADGLVTQLNALIEGVVTAVNLQDGNVEFVDVSGEFPSGACTSELIYPAIPAPGEVPPFAPASLHPTASGQQAYADAIEDAGFVVG